MKTGEEVPKDLPKVKTRTLWIIAISGLAALMILFVIGFVIRHERISKREKMAKEEKDRKLVVLIVKPKQTQKDFDLTLPADVKAFAATALYSRTNGFLATWTADINDRVKKGDVIAVISAPDTDANLEQAKAELNQNQTGYQLAQNTDERYKGLVSVQGVTQQQLDQFHSQRQQAKSNVGSSAASVDRMQALVGFEKIVAPFDGVITARNYDVGALISATNTASGQELFDIAQDDQLRVYVNIPQTYALLVKYGQPVDLLLARNYPGHTFTGVVTRSTGNIDPVTRTLKTELDFKNTDPAFHIFPGMYGEAVFHIQRPAPVLTIPTSALLFEADGKQVAVVTQDNKIHFQKITPGTDFGTEIEVLDGLKADERVVANPGEQLTEGVEVQPQENKPDDKKQGQQQKPDKDSG
ncbi:MAG TPA: efflux RND transporter periplasmic adaptor subunit [Opitutaceae bacterium]|nr:efflux RND transporter periplasmic adaptor subunit [Opitutaceae bacterium]